MDKQKKFYKNACIICTVIGVILLCLCKNVDPYIERLIAEKKLSKVEYHDLGNQVLRSSDIDDFYMIDGILAFDSDKPGFYIYYKNKELEVEKLKVELDEEYNTGLNIHAFYGNQGDSEDEYDYTEDNYTEDNVPPEPMSVRAYGRVGVCKNGYGNEEITLLLHRIEEI